MKSRLLRLSVATLLLGAALVTVAPHATSYVSSSAVVNAPVYTVRAPFDGTVGTTSEELATAIAAGETLVKVQATRQDRASLDALEAERAKDAAHIRSLGRHIARVEALKQDLEQRIVEHDAALSGWLAATRAAVVAAGRQAEARRDQLFDQRDRQARLVQRGALASSALEATEADLAIAAAEMDENAARSAALEAEVQALSQGIAIDGATDGGIYARQRLDDVTLQLLGLKSEHERMTARHVATEKHLRAMRADLEAKASFEPRAASAGVVWRAAPAAGTSVAIGDALVELLDCERRFVEVSLPGRHFENIAPGDPATTLLKGSGKRFTAHVEAVGGAGARFDHPNLASDTPSVAAGDVQILVRLDPVDLDDPNVAATFCDVGRTAEVRFARPKGAVAGQLIAHLKAFGGKALFGVGGTAEAATPDGDTR